MHSNIPAIAKEFTQSAIIEISSLGNGLINQTYRISTTSGAFVLQRINHQVFPYPELLMLNLQQLGRHLRQQPPTAVGLQIPEIILTLDHKSYYQDQNRHFWRALELIQPAESREKLSNPNEAKQVGFALAHFHRLLSNLPGGQMHDTLPGFHDTPVYFQYYQSIAQHSKKLNLNAETQFCQRFIESFQNVAVLKTAEKQGKLIERVMHGDPKLNNFLFAPNTDRIISLIDLDTVKPGLIHYDIGDCLRSCCHIPQSNGFDADTCETILCSYLQEAGYFFSDNDYDYLFSAIALIPFELGLRFFTDYRAGNKYFKVNDSEENLRRAIDQFQLCESIRKQQSLLEKLIRKLRDKSA